MTQKNWKDVQIKIPIWLKCGLLLALFYLLLLLLMFTPAVVVGLFGFMVMSVIAIEFTGPLLPKSLSDTLINTGIFMDGPSFYGIIYSTIFWFLLGSIYGLARQIGLARREKKLQKLNSENKNGV